MKKKICANKFGVDYKMCQYCSSMRFGSDGPYWMCKKYNKKLNENKDKFLVPCKECNETEED